MTREHNLTEQLVVRVTPLMRAALEADAEANGRSVAQSIRFHLRPVIDLTPEPT